MVDLSAWRERQRVEAEQFARELEGLGAIAYASSEGAFEVWFASGRSLRVDAFFYPEGGFLEIGGHHMPIWED